jgi:SAM-dependent methyltransferase
MNGNFIKNQASDYTANTFCTIITENYLPYALSLLNSISIFNNKITLHVLISDSENSVPSPNQRLKIHSIKEMSDNEVLQALHLKYYSSNHDAFRWSMKSVFIKHLLENYNKEKVIYVDSDIHFFSDYNFLFQELDTSNVILTPHWRASNPLVDKNNFDLLMTSGLYNAGFIGVNKFAVNAMDWWAKACLYKCEIDPTKGHFVDQTYLDLFHILFENVKVVRHRGLNVANWNQVECKRCLTKDGNVIINNTYPIVFIHFTASTIRGILSGQDSLLINYLKHYAESLKAIDSTIDLLNKFNPSNHENAKINGYNKNMNATNQPSRTKTDMSDENLYRENELFLKPPLNERHIDIYLIRSKILIALKSFLQECSGTLLDLGCGEMPYKPLIRKYNRITKYIGIDIENPTYQKTFNPDLFWDGSKIPMDNDSVNCVIATEVFEHVPKVENVLIEIRRVLKPDGKLFFTVPFLWPLHDVPYDEFRYTPFALERILKDCGFYDINLEALGGWHASMAQMLGLWLKRAPMNEQARANLIKQFMPFYKELISNDSIPRNLANGSTMITGLSGNAS